MYKNKLSLLTIFIVITLFATACSSSMTGLSSEASNILGSVLTKNSMQVVDQPMVAQEQSEPVAPIEPGLLAAYESTLTSIYEQVNPSVVNLSVVQNQPIAFSNLQQVPENSLASGFVWNDQGYIITNNHVVEGANKIEVTFSDDTVLPAELIGTDPDSDLAVIKVDIPANQLHPVQMGDSDQLRVGQLAIAIGNPFGLEGTMTVGIVSALGRSLPASDNLTGGPVYRIPDVIQTDAPINPGNSGGVLLNDKGEVIGVTAAIESTVGANAGIGFVIPSSIVERVVPELIKNGSYAHPYLGISGISLFPDLATAMDLQKEQKGALVVEVVPGSPADKAGLIGSGQQVTIDGQAYQVGGDLITAVDGKEIDSMDDLIAYLYTQVEVGQQINLTILRNGKTQDIQVTLEARPDENAQEITPQIETSGRAWLGIVGLALTPEIAQEMDLSTNQQGVLIEQVVADSPADQAGLRGSFKPVTINGEEILIGGDVITAIDGQEITNVQELSGLLQDAGSGKDVSLTVIRNGKQVTVTAILAEQP